MRRLINLSLLVAVALVLAACGSGTEDNPTGRDWQLDQLEGAALVDGTSITMTLSDDGTVSGSSGCNTYSGSVTIDEAEGTMTFGTDLISTMMACDQAIMDQEQKYLNALTQVVSYQMASDELLLLDDEGIAVATYN